MLVHCESTSRLTCLHCRPCKYDGKKANGEDGKPDRTEIAQLNANHSHYICVDNGQNGRFATEVAFRGDLEAFISCYDYDSRGKSLEELTEHFSQAVDESALKVQNEDVVSGCESQAIRLTEDDGEKVVTVVRVASNGDTARTYTIRVKPLVSTAEQQTPRNVAELSATLSRATSKLSSVRKFRTGNSVPAESGFTADGGDLIDIQPSYGQLEPLFSPDRLDYELSVPSFIESISLTPYLRAGPKPVSKVTVPSVMLSYGGGPGTLQTLDAAGSKPIIVIQGSLRAAMFLEDWVRRTIFADFVAIADALHLRLTSFLRRLTTKAGKLPLPRSRKRLQS